MKKRLDELKRVDLPEYKSSETQSDPLPQAVPSTTSNITTASQPVDKSAIQDNNEFDNINQKIRQEMIQTLNLISGELKQPDRTRILQQIQDKIKQIEILNKELDNVHRKQVDNKNQTSQIGKRFKFDVVFDKAGNPALAGMSGGMGLGITTNQFLTQHMQGQKIFPSTPEEIIVNSN